MKRAALAAVAACRHAPPPSPSPAPVVSPLLESGLPGASSPGVFHDGDAPEAYGVLMDAAMIVISAPFQRHLSAFSDLLATPDATQTVSGASVHLALVGLDPSSKRREVRYGRRLFEGRPVPCERDPFQPMPGLVANGTNPAADTTLGDPVSMTLLNACTLERATATPAEPSGYACAINTIVHEWTHVVVNANGEPLYLDRGQSAPSGNLVSFTAGAIAQCTFLESIHSMPYTFPTCVALAGTHSFNDGPCTRGWAKKQ